MLQALRVRGIRIGLCSNLSADYGPPLLAALPQLDGCVLSYQLGHCKPAPEAFAEAMRQLGSAPEQTWMVGDSWRSDVQGAQAVGLRALWLRRGDRNKDENSAEADAAKLEVETITNLRDVLGLLDEM